MLYAAGTGEHGRDDHNGAIFARDPGAEIHPRQRPRLDQQGCQPIGKRNAKLRSAEQNRWSDEAGRPVTTMMPEPDNKRGADSDRG